MCPAVALRNIVGETQHGFVKAVVPLHGDLNDDVVFTAADDNRRLENGCLRTVQILGELQQAALVVERFGRCVWLTRVREDNLNARIQECELPQTVLQSRILKLGLRECFNRWSEIDFRAGIAATVARHRKRTFRVAVMETHEVNFTVPLNGQVQFNQFDKNYANLAKNHQNSLTKPKGSLGKLEKYKKFDLPVLIGTSRKSTIGYVLDLPVEDRIEGTAATIAISITKKVDIVRVHDVKEMGRVVKMSDAIVRGWSGV